MVEPFYDGLDTQGFLDHFVEYLVVRECLVEKNVAQNDLCATIALGILKRSIEKVKNFKERYTEFKSFENREYSLSKFHYKKYRQECEATLGERQRIVNKIKNSHELSSSFIPLIGGSCKELNNKEFEDVFHKEIEKEIKLQQKKILKKHKTNLKNEFVLELGKGIAKWLVKEFPENIKTLSIEEAYQHINNSAMSYSDVYFLTLPLKEKTICKCPYPEKRCYHTCNYTWKFPLTNKSIGCEVSAWREFCNSACNKVKLIFSPRGFGPSKQKPARSFLDMIVVRNNYPEYDGYHLYEELGGYCRINKQRLKGKKKHKIMETLYLDKLDRGSIKSIREYKKGQYNEY